MDKAIEDDKGIRIRCGSEAEAQVLRQRLHQARVLDRKTNEKIHDEEHAMHGCSVYDELRITIGTTKSGVYVYIRKMALDASKVQNLSEVDEPVETAPQGDPRVLAAVVEAAKRRV